MKRDIFDLRAEAQARGGADYTIEKNYEFSKLPEGVARVTFAMCRNNCGNLLTVADAPGGRCRQCILQGRMA
jgi:hypothetical protein